MKCSYAFHMMGFCKIQQRWCDNWNETVFGVTSEFSVRLNGYIYN